MLKFDYGNRNLMTPRAGHFAEASQQNRLKKTVLKNIDRPHYESIIGLENLYRIQQLCRGDLHHVAKSPTPVGAVAKNNTQNIERTINNDMRNN